MKRSTTFYQDQRRMRLKRKLRAAWRRDGEWISMALVVVILASAGAFLASESMAAFTRAAATTLEQ